MAKVSLGAGISSLWPFTSPRFGAGKNVVVHPRRLVATVASAFFVVAAAAWGLALLQHALAGTPGVDRGTPAVAFQPSQLVSTQHSVGYLGR